MKANTNDHRIPFNGSEQDGVPAFSAFLNKRKVGRGQLGNLYYAQTDNSDVLAVQIVHRGKMSADQMSALNSEMALMSKIASCNVVKVLDVTRSKSLIFIAQQMSNGGTLADFVRARGGRLCEQEARLIIR